jgi:hypothetical protein
MPPVTLTVRDETTSGELLADLELQLDAETVTVAELIRTRVHQEVRNHNAKAASAQSRFFGLVQPDDTERELNGYRMRNARRVDAERQTANQVLAVILSKAFLLAKDIEITDTAISSQIGQRG